MGAARKAAVAGCSVLGVALFGAGDVTANVHDVVPGPFTTQEPWQEADPFPTASLPPQAPSSSIVPDWNEAAPVPTFDGLYPALRDLVTAPEVGTPPGVIVVDVLSGQVLAESDGTTARLPASTTKVLTGAAAVATLDLDETLATSAVLAGADELYLVGTGDMALAAGAGKPDAVIGHAGLGDLADATASALTSRGLASVTLAYDITAFAEEAQAPGWGTIDFSGGHVTTIQALGIEVGRVEGQTPRDTNSARTAAETFAQALRDRGIEVREVAKRAAPEGSATLASVQSAPLGELLDLALADSSNTLTEVFGRLVAIERGEPATFAGATTAVIDAIANLGLDVSGTQLGDTSGLSSENRIAPRLLVDVLRKAATDPSLSRLAVALPVSGLDGTLANRWLEPGLVRAKTGTLVSVVSLAGYAPTADGRLLAFAVMADQIPYAGSYAARLEIDTWVNTLLTCGCQ
ncbi:D-alanyl-D-alanine carboxypeptidase/D-alanyl-D-alanine endopeptidase [Salana multivorans]